MRPRPPRRGEPAASRIGRRAAALSALVLGAVVLLPTAAFADGAADIGDKRDPDPLSPLQAWGIFGGVIVGAFLIGVILMALSTRNSPTEARYRPGRAWEHDPEWFGPQPEVAEGQRPRAALPGAGGASGRW